MFLLTLCFFIIMKIGVKVGLQVLLNIQRADNMSAAAGELCSEKYCFPSRQGQHIGRKENFSGGQSPVRDVMWKRKHFVPDGGQGVKGRCFSTDITSLTGQKRTNILWYWNIFYTPSAREWIGTTFDNHKIFLLTLCFSRHGGHVVRQTKGISLKIKNV